MKSSLGWCRLCCVLLVALILGGCSRKSTLEGVEGMAAMAPKSALAFAGFDVRKAAEWEQFLTGFEKMSEDPEMAGKTAAFEKQLGGLKADDLIEGIDPAGWAAVLDPAGKGQPQDLTWVVGLMVRDRKHVEACLRQASKDQRPTATEVRGETVESYPRGFFACFHDGFVLISNKTQGIEAALGAKDGNLAGQPAFQEARQRILDGKADIFTYVPTAPVLEFGSRFYQSQGGKLDESH